MRSRHLPSRSLESVYECLALQLTQLALSAEIAVAIGASTLANCLQNVEWEHVAQRQRAIARDNHSALDHVLQLTDVSWPVVGTQSPQAIRCQFSPWFSHSGAAPIDEKLGQYFDVAAPFTQWRDHDGKNIEPVEKVLAKT